MYRFKENRPGRNWVRGFIKRHKEQVVVRVPSNIRRSRAAVSPDENRAVAFLYLRYRYLLV
jgi:hypothetical protein